MRRSLGPPLVVKRGFLRWCVSGGGRFLVGEPSDRSGELGAGLTERAVLILSTSSAFRYHGVGPGSSTRAFRRAFRRARRLTRYGNVRVWLARPRSRVLIGIRRRRVRFIALRDRGAVRGGRSARRYLLRAR